MELLFVWTAEFRNLKNVGFNFSEKVKFTYYKDTQMLEVATKEDPRPGFFGESITNVTAIIGKNGTGKSNLLDLICYLTKGTSRRFNNYVLIYGDSSNDALTPYVCKTNIGSLKLNAKFRRVEPEKSITEVSAIFFSNISDGREQKFSKEIIDISQNAHVGYSAKKGDVFNQVRFLLSDYVDNVELSKPNNILISSKTDVLIKRQIKGALESHPAFEMIIKRYQSGFRRVDPPTHFRFAFRYSLFVYSLNHLFQGFNENSSSGLVDHSSFKEGVTKLLNQYFRTEFSMSISEIHKQMEGFLRDMCFQFGRIGEIESNDMELLLRFDSVIEGMHPEVSEEKVSRKAYFKFFFDNYNQRIFKDYIKVFEYPDLIDVIWDGLSSGHKAFLNMFAQLHSTIRRVARHENVIICIDEGDLYLHPEWQRQFLNRIIKFVPIILKKKLQFILTTHSPFLVSDLPKENLIIIQTMVNGDCEIITTVLKDKQTFGANIYDLYKGPFVLEKSTVSEFAFEKISRAIELLKKSKHTSVELDEVKQIVSAVGDESVRYKLYSMVDNAQNNL
jgi:AAA15 family ATPase/GTPase